MNDMKRLFFIILLVAGCLSCGSPRTAIRVTNKADGSQTDISIVQGDGGSTEVRVVPKFSVAVDTVSFATNPVRDGF